MRHAIPQLTINWYLNWHTISRLSTALGNRYYSFHFTGRNRCSKFSELCSHDMCVFCCVFYHDTKSKFLKARNTLPPPHQKKPMLGGCSLTRSRPYNELVGDKPGIWALPIWLCDNTELSHSPVSASDEWTSYILCFQFLFKIYLF